MEITKSDDRDVLQHQIALQLGLDQSCDIDHLAHRVIGAAIEVHRHLGPSFVEAMYQSALETELGLCGIPFRSQVAVPITYKGRVVGSPRLDLLVDERLIVELKVSQKIVLAHISQVLVYLEATRCGLGVILNFGEPIMKTGVKRVRPRHALRELADPAR